MKDVGIEQLRAERDADVAQAALLRVALEQIRDVLAHPGETIWIGEDCWRVDAGYPSEDESEFSAALLHEALTTTPAEALDRLKADAGRERAVAAIMAIRDKWRAMLAKEEREGRSSAEMIQEGRAYADMLKTEADEITKEGA